MVQLLFLNTPKPLLGATRAAVFQSVTIQLFTVTALLGIFGNARAQKGTAINKGVEVSKRGRSSVG